MFFQGEYPISNGRGGHHEHDEESNDRFSRGRPGDFRPESGMYSIYFLYNNN